MCLTLIALAGFNFPSFFPLSSIKKSKFFKKSNLLLTYFIIYSLKINITKDIN